MEQTKKKGFFGRLSQRIGDAIMLRPQIDDEFLEELEEILITSDIGMETSLHISEALREAVRRERLADRGDVEKRIAEIVEGLVDKGERNRLAESYPLIILMIGVNGGGKTTTIAKLASLYIRGGKRVLLAAADTFRAAAADQLEVWADRAGADIVRHAEGADPSAVIYDAIAASKARGTDVLICDTAGRLQNKKNLMNELEKMNKIIEREYPEAARETLLVLDATTGKNAVSQAKEFGSVADITGIVLTKLDGTAKGGIAITVSDEFDLPIKLLGVGERMQDLDLFDAKTFAESIFAEGAGV
ncbi:MAG: signal recognition particle-docking protein FtsY [Clostridiales Family XIII bacterium]|jgi:fused signal recognition particle receptor|nr:signal recognition particle-docking protein FtsY [Clostridiales Family XIII bacterium]